MSVMKERGVQAPEGVRVRGALASGYERILTEPALAFIADLERKFGARRRDLLAARRERQKAFDGGALPDFLPETKDIREGDWQVDEVPADLRDRRVEITGPTDRKMIINALNSGARVFMTDFEDALSPTWQNVMQGQINLADLWDRKIDFTDPGNKKHYALGDKPATLIVRPRGWHLDEAHIEVDGKAITAAFVDFGLYLFHNHAKFAKFNTGPYFYLPKMESHKEAALWDDVFCHAQKELGLSLGTIKVTVLIETLPAAFEMAEILHALRRHIAGLNCGRWDYIFSYIKCLSSHADRVLPDRAQVVMGKAFLNAYSLRLISTCHRHGAFAMGGMAAQIPVKGDEAANEAAFAKVRADKEREAKNGHDGTWVAHPGLVPVAMEVFDRVMPGPNQLDKIPTSLPGQKEMLEVHEGARTEEGLRECIRVGVQYIEAWLGGAGAVPLYNLMEDAATAEICRTQIWQWLRYGAKLTDGRAVDEALFRATLDEEMAALRGQIGETRWTSGRFDRAIEIFSTLATSDSCEAFLTLPAYRDLALFID